MSLVVGFIRQVGPHGVDEPYRALLTDCRSSEELSKLLAEGETEDRVEAFMIHESALCDILEILGGDETGSPDSFAHQLENLLTRVYKIGRGRAMTDIGAILQLQNAAKGFDALQEIYEAYHNKR